MVDIRHKHSSLIDELGGTSTVAKLFDVKPPSVSGWRKNGIPKARLQCLALMRPELFLRESTAAFGGSRHRDAA